MQQPFGHNHNGHKQSIPIVASQQLPFHIITDSNRGFLKRRTTMRFSKKLIWQKLLKLRQQQNQISRIYFHLHCRENFKNLDTFHRAFRPCLLMAQIFGVMPLVNTLHSNPYRLTFKLPCWTFISTVLFFIFGGILAMLYTVNMISKGINPKNIVGLVFYFINVIICINFLNLARYWPQLIQHWTRIDLLFLMPPFKPPKWSLRKQLRTLLIWFWMTALLEHCLFYASRYYNFRMLRLHCHPNDTRYTFKHFIYMDMFQNVFKYISENLFVAAQIFFINGTFNFLWNFSDFFIMALSLALATRFQQFNARIEVLADCYVPDALWYKIRRQHILLCEFMEQINDHVSTIVFISCLNNMYFICNQLLNIFTKLRYPINYVYFWFSLIFLLMRTICVFMFASEIHDASVSPLKTLYLVPSGCWTMEVHRFIAQIINETIGLTGKRFYLVTRQNLFGMMATIVTYEFMLLQFDTKNQQMHLPDLCI